MKKTILIICCVFFLSGLLGYFFTAKASSVSEPEQFKDFFDPEEYNEIAEALEYMKEGKIIADELITREVTLDTLVEDGFEYLIKHGPEQIKVLIKISE